MIGHPIVPTTPTTLAADPLRPTPPIPLLASAGRGIARVVCAVATLFVGACSTAAPSAEPAAPEPESDQVVRYLSDPAFRRAELVASLVNPSNAYSKLRLGEYGEGWESLPVWSPRVAPIQLGDLDPSERTIDAPLSPDATALDVSADAQAGSIEALQALGAQAFFLYPAQLLPTASAGLTSLMAAESHGLWTDAARGVGGLVRAEMANGSTLVAMTCATCHVSADAGALRIGAPNARLDLGRLALDALGDDGSALSTNMRAWGPGRVDVSTQDGSQPARIPDVRPTRFLTHLHQEATLEQRDVATLAIRIETLILTSHGQVLRPPRPVAVGLALYVWSLADALPAPSTSSRTPGASLFQEDCATCHHSEGFTGAPIPLDEIGTDPKLGRSTERGTGMYRVPSLRGVGSRGPLLHDASLPSVEALLDPSRTSAGYAGGRAPGPVPGHTYGLTRTAEERAALAAFVKGL